MRKNKNLLIILLISLLGLICVACSSSNTDETEITDFTFTTLPMRSGENILLEYTSEESGKTHYITEAGILELAQAKNKECEMEINKNGYNVEDFNELNELYTQIKKTHVSIEVVYKTNDGSKDMLMSSGNIYDIDDEYIYVITCKHGFRYPEIVVIRAIIPPQNGIRFASVEIPIEDIVFTDIDFAMFKIKKETISTELLKEVKSINIDNLLKVSLNDFQGYTLYCTKLEFGEWTKYYATGFNYDLQDKITAFDITESSIQNGASGGGLFDKYGNYYGQVLTSAQYKYHYIGYLKETLLQLNPNYFD